MSLWLLFPVICNSCNSLFVNSLPMNLLLIIFRYVSTCTSGINQGAYTCCTNGYEETSNDTGNDLFDTAFECCEDGLDMGNSGKCPYEDVCFPPAPTPPAVIVSTPMPTFGSTPTVSKETTGPPTLPADRVGRD